MPRLLGGVHIGQDEIAMIALKPTRQGLAVVAAAAHDLAPDEQAAPGAALRALLKKSKSSPESATIVLPKEHASLQHAVLPSNDAAEVQEMARFEAERHIPFNVERHTFGHQVLRDAGVGGTEVLLAAADGPVVERALGTLRDAGVKPEGLNVSSAALMNALLFARPDVAKMQTVAIIGIGLGALDLVFASEGRALFCRSVALGLRSLIKDWQSHEGGGGGAAHLDGARAAAAAKMIDMMDLEGRYSDSERAERHGAATSKEGESARKWAGRLIHEIRRSYDFARRELNCPAIQAVILAGEGCALRNLGQYLYVNLNVETIVLNPVGALGGEAVERLPFGGLEMTLPFGGAVQGLVEGGYRIDLTPAAYYRESDKRQLIRRLSTTGAFVAVALGLGVGAWLHFRSLQSRLATEYAQINDKMEPVARKLREQETKLRILEGFWNDPSNALAILAFVQSYPGAPKEISIKAVSFAQGDRAIVKGHAFAVDDIVKFKEELLRSGLFDDVIVVEQNLRRALPRRPEVYDFWLECTIPAYEPMSKKRTRNERAGTRKDAAPRDLRRGETDFGGESGAHLGEETDFSEGGAADAGAIEIPADAAEDPGEPPPLAEASPTPRPTPARRMTPFSKTPPPRKTPTPKGKSAGAPATPAADPPIEGGAGSAIRERLRKEAAQKSQGAEAKPAGAEPKPAVAPPKPAEPETTP